MLRSPRPIGRFSAASVPARGEGSSRQSRRTSPLVGSAAESGCESNSDNTSPFSHRSTPHAHSGGGGTPVEDTEGCGTGSERYPRHRGRFSPSSTSMDLLAGIVHQHYGSTGGSGGSGRVSPHGSWSPRVQVQPIAWDPSRAQRRGDSSGRVRRQVSRASLVTSGGGGGAETQLHSVPSNGSSARSHNSFVAQFSRGSAVVSILTAEDAEDAARVGALLGHRDDGVSPAGAATTTMAVERRGLSRSNLSQTHRSRDGTGSEVPPALPSPFLNSTYAIHQATAAHSPSDGGGSSRNDGAGAGSSGGGGDLSRAPSSGASSGAYHVASEAQRGRSFPGDSVETGSGGVDLSRAPSLGGGVTSSGARVRESAARRGRSYPGVSDALQQALMERAFLPASTNVSSGGGSGSLSPPK